MCVKFVVSEVHQGKTVRKIQVYVKIDVQSMYPRLQNRIFVFELPSKIGRAKGLQMNGI